MWAMAALALWAACVALPAAASRIAMPVEISAPGNGSVAVSALALAGAAPFPALALPRSTLPPRLRGGDSPLVGLPFGLSKLFVPAVTDWDRFFDGRAAAEPERLAVPLAAPEKPSGLRRARLLAAAPLKLLTNRATNDRDWSEDVKVLPEVRFSGDRVAIKNVRNFEYRSTRDWTPRYYDAEYDLRDVEKVWYLTEPFGPGQAHTFVSFGFKDGRYLSVSVEIRRVKGDAFSPWRGLFNGFELTYVIADERDVARLRSNYRRHDLFVYPMRTSSEQARALLVDMLTRAEAIRKKPEFYNTFTSTCLTNIVDSVNRVFPRKIRWGWRIFFTGFSDRLAYDLGLIDTDLPFEQARERFRATDRARAAERAPDFSSRIRR